jgi:thiamine-phosphate diphosphorylase
VKLPRLHLVTDDAILGRSDFPERAVDVARTLAEAGATGPGASGPGDGRSVPDSPGVALHLRGPGTPGRRLWERARALRDPLREAGVRLLVNDRADVARAVEADGVHLPGRGLPAPWIRSWLGPDVLVGRSVPGDPGEEASPGGISRLDAGEVEALDYLLVGTLWESPTHPGRPGTGPERLRRVERDLQRGGRCLPLVGIGGLTPQRVAEVRAAGGYGVAVRGGIWDSADPPRAALAFATALTTVGEGKGGQVANGMGAPGP